jgi:hypothetical protein
MSHKPSRSETLALLCSLGIEIPEYTKLSDKALKQRLAQALNASQSLLSCLSGVILDPDQLPTWSGGSVYEAVKRVNPAEAIANLAARTHHGRLNADELGKNPFMDARQTLMSLGRGWVDDMSVFLLDNDESHGMLIRVCCPPIYND